MDEADERQRHLEAYAKLNRMGAEQISANERRVGRDTHNANKIATISLTTILIVTIATIVGVIVIAIAPHLGFSLGPAAFVRF